MDSHYIPIPIIDRMTAVLDYITDHPEGATATELLRAIDIPKTTLYRLLTSMAQNGYLSFIAETGCYTIGGRFLSGYVSIDERAAQMRTLALPYMQKLAAFVQETAKLSILSGMRSYTIASVESSKPVRISVDPGAIFPLHAGAAGKVLMCNLSEREIRSFFQKYAEKYTDMTIMDPDAMISELNDIRKRGYAVDRGEFLPEIRAIGGPVKDKAGQVIAAISIAYPAAAESSVHTPTLIEAIHKTADTIGTALQGAERLSLSARLVTEPSAISRLSF